MRLRSRPGFRAGAEKKEGAVSLDVPIPNLTLPLMVEDRRVVGRLELSLQVHATDASAVGKLEEMLPRIRDLLLTRITPHADPRHQQPVG